MNGIVFYIGLGCGLAAACGLRPFLPLLLAGVLASDGALGVAFAPGRFHFLQAGWWLLLVTVALVLSYLAQIGFGQAAIARSRDGAPHVSPLGAALTGLGAGAGALLFAGTLAAHGDAWWPGVVGGLLAAALATRAVTPLLAGAMARLPDRAAREALTVYLDAAALAAAAVVALLHPLGYVALGLLALLLLRTRSRAGEKYAGLRILRR